MRTSIRLGIASVGLAAGVLVGCGDDDEQSSSADTTAASADADASATTAASTTVDSTAETTSAAPAGGPGGGGEADPSSVTTEDALIELIAVDAYGDGSLDLHRGHMPIQTTLEETLGITHDEMHVRMEEQSQNLAAVADDLGVGADNLITVLVESFAPAIDNVLAAGEITEDEAAQYLADLEEAFTFRVNWDGEEAAPSYTGVS